MKESISERKVQPGKSKTIFKIRRYKEDIMLGLTNAQAKRLREYRRKRDQRRKED